MIDLPVALEAKALSDRQAGEQILALWEKREHLSKYPTKESIATKLGRLKKGDASWWKKQPQALAALAQLLVCKVEDLLPEEAARRVAIEFEAFSELSPLLPGQEPCAVRDDVSWLGALADARVRQQSRSWIIAPDGAGKSLAIRVLQQRHGSSMVVATTRSLFEAARVAKDTASMVVEVDEAEPLTDTSAFEELTRRTSNLCILAPFQPPSSASSVRWHCGRWTPQPGWRKRLVAWACARLPAPEKLDLDELQDWLDVIDPQERFFGTPGHLLPLLARAYRAGLPKGRHALLDLSREVLTQLARQHSTPTWLRNVGVVALEKMLNERLGRLDLPLGPLTVEDWTSLVPTELTQMAPGPAAKEKPSKGSRLASPQPTAEVPPPRLAVHMLADARFLQTQENGRLDVSPWVRLAFERNFIVREVKTRGPRWPLWAVENSRKDAVDDALDTLSPSELVSAAAVALAADPNTLETVAAIEAIFAAVGRRLLQEKWRPETAQVSALQELGRRQLHLLSSVPKVGTARPFLPITRHRPGWQDRLQIAWLAEAWAFSFAVERPGDVEPEPGWEFPGWSRGLSLSGAPDELRWWSQRTTEELMGFKRLSRIAREAVKVCSDKVPPDDVHGLLLPWVIVDGPGRGWPLTRKICDRLLDSTELGTFVAELLAHESVDTRERVSALLWEATMERARNPGNALSLLGQHASSLQTLVVEHLPADAFAASITRQILEHSDHESWLHGLPPRLIRASLPVFARYIRETGRSLDQMTPVVALLGEGDLDLLVELTLDKYGVGVAAAKRLWELDPSRATQEAHSAVHLKQENRGYAWFFAAPPSYHDALLDILENVDSPVSWTDRWLVEILPLTGAAAPRVFAMMKSAGSSPTTTQSQRGIKARYP